MKIKNILYILITSLLVSSCEDVVQVDVPNGQPRLVIDASFEFSNNIQGIPEPVESTIKLTMSAPFFNQTVPPVSGATVFITNLTLNETLNFEETFTAGYYNPTNDFSWNYDSDYELTVIHNNETYKATTQIIPSVPIDNVIQGDNTLFEGDETEVIISFTDNGTRDDFYLFNLDFDLFLSSEDRFYQGESFKFSYFYENMIVGKEVMIKILGIDKQYFNYSTLLIEQSEQQDGNPFQTPPAILRGNIINITNPDNFVLGYYNLSEAHSFPIIIQ